MLTVLLIKLLPPPYKNVKINKQRSSAARCITFCRINAFFFPLKAFTHQPSDQISGWSSVRDVSHAGHPSALVKVHHKVNFKTPVSKENTVLAALRSQSLRREMGVTKWSKQTDGLLQLNATCTDRFYPLSFL